MDDTSQLNPTSGTGRQKILFGREHQDSFLRDVRKRVDAYFQSRNIPKTANARMVVKTILILIGWIATYTFILSNLLPAYALLLLALCHGFLTAMIGLNIGHDAIHGSYSRRAGVNRKLGLFFNLIGANDYVWRISHNIVHHTYTNIPHHDEDINQPGVLRLERSQKLRRIHRFQHIYAFLVYGLASLSWVFVKDYVKMFQRQLGGHYRSSIPRKEIIRLFAYKALYYSVFLVVPLVVIHLPWYWILLGFMLAHFVEGFTLAIIFMLAHIIEGTAFPEPGPNGKLDMSWGDLQMHTTCNFAVRNPLVNYLFGGLNFQVEHHLFPNVCHIHYPRISEIVRQTSRAHNLPYLEKKTFFGAIASHRRMLKQLGTEE
ncbi:MAG: acyl-CoA desaturase [Saprospiraceae bacterium]|nr:acyl-CoA desaturase [Saprospiraceae bacterium]